MNSATGSSVQHAPETDRAKSLDGVMGARERQKNEVKAALFEVSAFDPGKRFLKKVQSA